MIQIALAFADGRLGVMQYYGPEPDIEVTIAKMKDKPLGWRRINDEEAASIRAARPLPEPAPVPTGVNTVSVHLQAENEDLKRRIAALEETFTNFLLGAMDGVEKMRAQEGGA